MMLRPLILVCTCLWLAGCQGLAYYGQAAQGQFALMAKRERISTLIAGETTAPELRERLLRVQRIRAFADRELALPVRGQYDRYVALGRDYPVWSVMATPPLSLRPHQWCYPVLGCLAYRGYFREQGAQKEAARRAV
ncbi:MAG: aminopeptidase, partial [Moraxellaceae bacterium]